MMDKKLFIFDLDDTLYLRKLSKQYDYSEDILYYLKELLYYHQIRHILYKLKQKNKIIALASHNLNPIPILNYLEITQYFSIIIGLRIDKDIMVSNILKETNCSKEETIFFDDQLTNIIKVNELGIDVYYVEDMFGIDLDFFNKYLHYNQQKTNDNQPKTNGILSYNKFELLTEVFLE